MLFGSVRMKPATKPPFSQIWNLVVLLAGQQFRTKRGLPFTYKVRGASVVPSRTAYQISQADFQTVYTLVPLTGPGEVNTLVRGPAYVWAILHDHRVSGGAW